MAIRKIVEIDEEKCDGCGLCVPVCAEGAIQIIDNKAKVVSETYCDGLGTCLGECPQNAITIVEREAPDFDEVAVERHLATLKEKQSTRDKPIVLPTTAPQHHGGGCPGSAMRSFGNYSDSVPEASPKIQTSQLRHWPVQLMLVPPQAPFLKGSDILICADCVPFVVPDFHSKYLVGKSLLVGCPKLDDLEFYFEKIKDIIATAKPKRLTVVKMEVPCCTGIAQAVIRARNEMAIDIPVEIYTIGIRGGEQCINIEAGNAA
jgi:ferredoxin